MLKKTEHSDLLTQGDLSELERIREFIIVKANTFGFSNDIAYKIALAVDEACSNLIKHSFKFDSKKTISISIETERNAFTVIISDYGNPFDPNNISSPNMKEYFEHFNRGGLGVHIMKSVMDEISYIPSQNIDSSNKLILRKFIN